MNGATESKRESVVKLEVSEVQTCEASELGRPQNLWLWSRAVRARRHSTLTQEAGAEYEAAAPYYPH